MYTRYLSCFLFVYASLTFTSALSFSSTKSKWKPKVASLEDRRKLRGGVKHDAETIGSIGFHHVEFYCGDARSMATRFSLGLGMPITGSTGQHTGNDKCVSYGLESGNVRFLLTAPYSKARSSVSSSESSPEVPEDAPNPLPGFSPSEAHSFFSKHGLAARAVGIEVKDTKAAFEASVAKGARPVLEPTYIPACGGQKGEGGEELKGCHMAEVELYGDVVLRYVSFPERNESTNLPFLPHLHPMKSKMVDRQTIGIHRFDHAVGNVWDLLASLAHISEYTGFHDFAEFTTEDVGTVDSGLNSVVMASDTEDILLPLNEPTEGK
jgi:4-hydroxyphenylpyruvate dioxygenase